MIKVSKIWRRFRSFPERRGQSLVELSLITPIVLLLLLGLTEVGAALRSFLVVSNAAREGARYGAKSKYTPDENIVDWVRQSAVSLPITANVDGVNVVDGEKATVIVTRLRKVFSEGSYEYEVEDSYLEGGDGRDTVLTEEWFTSQEQKSQELDEKEWPVGVPREAMDMIAVEVMFDHDHLTGLFSVGSFLPDPVPLHAMTVMRIGGSRVPICDAYPIGVRLSTVEGLSAGQNWQGDIYEGDGSGQFGWLRWPSSQGGDAGYLEEMLLDPGLSRSDFDNPSQPDDHWLNTGDDVYGNTGISNSSGVRNALEKLKGEKIRVPVWEYFHDGSGPMDPDYYHIVGFVWIEIIEYDLPSGHGGGTITAFFRGWDDTCTEAQ